MVQNGSFKHIGRLPFWIFKLKFFNSLGTWETFCIILPKFVDIGHTIAEILGFFMTDFFQVKYKKNSLNGHA